MAELFIRLGEAEGFDDFVSLTFMADQGANVALVLQNTAHHPGQDERQANFGTMVESCSP